MIVTIEWMGLTLTAECDYEPYVPARISGPPEDCYPSEGGYAEITDLKCGKDDASFLLQSADIREELDDLAYAACEDSIQSDRESAAESAAEDRALERRYG